MMKKKKIKPMAAAINWKLLADFAGCDVKDVRKVPLKKPKPQCKHCGSFETFNVIFFWDEKDLAQTEYECMNCTDY